MPVEQDGFPARVGIDQVEDALLGEPLQGVAEVPDHFARPSDFLDGFPRGGGSLAQPRHRASG